MGGVECHAYDFRESALLQQRSVAAEHSLVVDGRVESRRRANRIAPRRSRQSRRRSEHISPILRPHTVQSISLPTTPHRRGNIKPVPRLQLPAIHRKTKRIPRLGNNPTDKRLVLVRERPPVRSDTARRLPENSHFGRVAAEPGDVLVHPFDGASLVAETQVLDVVWSAREAEDAEAVGQSDDDGAGGFGEAAAVVEGGVGVADGEAWCLGVSRPEGCRGGGDS